MKCRLLRDMERACETPEEHAAFRATGTFPIVPAGTLIDHPQAHHQVRLGNAEPADAECEPYRLAPSGSWPPRRPATRCEPASIPTTWRHSTPAA